MKTWLTKFKISNALDNRQPLPSAVERNVAHSEQLRRFAETTAVVNQALKSSSPVPEAPAALHAAIMRAVRDVKPELVFDWQKLWPRLIPTIAVALLILLGFFEFSHFYRKPAVVSSPVEASTFAVASSALETSDMLVRTVPDAALSPLNDEMKKLHRDLDGTKKFLLASLP